MGGATARWEHSTNVVFDWYSTFGRYPLRLLLFTNPQRIRVPRTPVGRQFICFALHRLYTSTHACTHESPALVSTDRRRPDAKRLSMRSTLHSVPFMDIACTHPSLQTTPPNPSRTGLGLTSPLPKRVIIMHFKFPSPREYHYVGFIRVYAIYALSEILLRFRFRRQMPSPPSLTCVFQVLVG